MFICTSLGIERAWSIKVNGVCQNISDTTADVACRGVQAQGADNVIFGQSDTCDMGKVEAVVDYYTNCEALSNSARAWSIKVNGVCQNITDTDVRTACRGMVSQNARNVIYGQSDTCDMGKVEAVVDNYTNCETMSSSTRAWSVKIDGACVNISDTDVRSACRGIQANNAPNVLYGQSDSCDTSKVVAIVNRYTDCNMLSSSTRVWSAKINGVCQNISDTDAVTACKAIGYQSSPNLVFGQTDSCDMSKVIMSVTRRTQCSNLPNGSDRSWSIKVNGVCQNISDTTVAQACLGVQSEMR